MNEKGMTLLELVVYMFLAALIMAPIVMLMQNSSKTMAHDATTTDMRMTGQDVLNIMYNDLKNTGFKLNTCPDSNLMPVAAARMNPTAGRESFTPTLGTGANIAFDRIQARVGRLNPDGIWCGVETITYSVNTADTTNRLLIRNATGYTANTCNPGNCPPITPAPGNQTIAQNIVALKFEYSADQVVWRNAPDTVTAGARRRDMEFVRVTIVLRDNKRLSPTRPALPIKVTNNYTLTPTANDQRLYERHSIVIPIPNNGLEPW